MNATISPALKKNELELMRHEQYLSLLSSLKLSRRVLKLFVSNVFKYWNETLEVTRRESLLRDEKIKQSIAERITTNQENAKGMLTNNEALSHIEDLRKNIVVLTIEKSEIKIDEYNTETVKNFTESFLSNLY